MPTPTKSKKIKISVCILWSIVTMLIAGGLAQEYSSFNFLTFLGAFTVLNLPLLMYWLGFWIWGDGYIFKGISFLSKKIVFKKKSISKETVRKTLSFIAAIFILTIVVGIVGALEDIFASISDNIGAAWNIIGVIGGVFLAIKTYKKCAGTEDKVEIIEEHIPLPDNHKNYFLKHWYGEHSLVRSYWINGALVNILFGIVVSLLTYDLSFDESPQFTAYALIFMWAVIFVVTIWQAVGIWRSANNYSKRSKKSWGKVAQALTILGMLGFISTIFTTTLPQVKEFWLIGSGNDPMGQFQLRVLRDATELEFSGYIGFGATEKTEEYLEAHPAIKLIHLNSIGGRVESARKLAALIESKGLSTYTSYECSSACIIPYAAGKERLIAKNAKLGFHQYDFPGAKQSDFYSDYAMDSKYLLSKGISQQFVDRIFDTPPSEMWEPSHEELISGNFITRYPDYSDVAITNILPSELNKFEKTLSQTPIYQAIKEASPEGYDQIVMAYRQAVERGQSMSEVRKVSLPIIIEILYQRLPYTSGEALLEYTQLLVDQYKHYEMANPQKCYSYAHGSDVGVDTSDLPQELIDRELGLTGRVISEYSQFNEIPNEEDVLAFLEEVFGAVGQAHGEDAALILEDNHSFEDRPKYCSITISLYEEILKLPPSSAVKTLRHMFGQI